MTAPRLSFAGDDAFAIGTDGEVRIRLDRGDIHVQGVEGDRVAVHALDGGAPSGIEMLAGPGRLDIGQRAGDTPSGPRGGLSLEIPATASIVIESKTADLLARELRGTQRYRTASGDIVLQGVSGAIVADAASGDIAVEAEAEADLSLRSISGDIGLTAATITALRATTTSGDLRVGGRFASEGPFRIETVSGDTDLAVVGDATIEVETVSGDVSTDRAIRGDDHGRPGRTRRFTVGTGRGPTVAVRSTSGDVTIEPGSEDADGTRRGRASRGTPAPAGAGVDADRADQPAADQTAAATPPAGDEPATADEPADLAILRALERGEIGVAEAGRRLTALEGHTHG